NRRGTGPLTLRRHGPAAITHHLVPSDITVMVLLMFVAVATGASRVKVGTVPAGVPTGVMKHRSCVQLFALMRLTIKIRPALLAAAGKVIVTPVAPVPAALHRTT